MQKKILFNLIIISLAGIILTSLSLFIVQTINAHSSADESFATRFSDVEERIELSRIQTQELTETIKEDYLSRARALAMIIDLNPDIINNRAELFEVAETLDVAELHIIDENGILKWGTVEEYFGMDFSTTEQTLPFLDILDDPAIEFAQEPMPNGFKGLVRQYAAVALRSGKGIAQIGMVPERYEQALENCRIYNVLRDVHIKNTGYIYSIDLTSGLINSHPNSTLIGTQPQGALGDSGFTDIDGKRVRYNAKSIDGNLLVAVIPTAELYAERSFFTPIFVCFAVLVFGVFCLSVNAYMKKNVITGILDTVNTLECISSGNLNVTANVHGNAEFVKLSDGINHMLSGIKAMISENAKLAGERGRLGAIVAIADAGIIITDKDGLITDWNTGAAKILGYEADEMIGLSPKAYTPEEGHAGINAIHERLASGEHIAHVDVVKKHKDGRIINCSVSYSPIFNEKDEYNGTITIFHDVTEKKLTEKKAQKLGALVSNSNAGIVVRDENDIITDWNIGAESILGYSADEIIGQHANYYMPDDMYDEADDVTQSMHDGKFISHVVEVVRKHKDGHLVDCTVSYSPIYDDNGCFAGSVAIFHDISDKKQIENELEETIAALWEAVAAAEKASSVKSTFLANMSHEIRTPMNAVIGMSDLLLSEKLTPRQHRFAADIKSSGANLLGIINNILDLSKIEAGKLELVPIDYDLYALLENIDSVFNFSAQSKNITYISEQSEDLPQFLFGDDIRLRQILTNLLGNAVKFTSKGYVKLKTWCDDSFIFIDVSDTGIGIKLEDIGKLFDAFEQVDSGINRSKVGTGLGLSITKSIVEAMKGSILVTSEYGKGTTFNVQLPYVLGDAEKIQAQRGTDSFIYAPEANVLVVDDFDVNVNVALGLLGLFGIRADSASGGAEAIEMIKKKKYDIIFMDHMMPEMDGVETTVRIRLMGYEASEYPIIALTANAVEGVSEMLIDSGMNDFLSKPIDKLKLNELLSKWLPAAKVLKRETGEADEQENRLREYSENDIIRRLRKIKLLDVDTGLGFMGNSEKLYKNTLRIVTKRIPELLQTMSDYLKDSDTKRFTSDVHCIKSSLGTIGAETLAKQAFDIEQKAKAGNIDYCVQIFPSFYASLMSLHEKLHSVFFADTEQQTLSQPSDLKQKLLEAERCINLLEDETALDILSQLCKEDFGTEINEAIKQITKQVEFFEFKKASDSLSGLIDMYNDKKGDDL